MRYMLLLWPHANARYQQESQRLAQAELQLILARRAPQAEVSVGSDASLPSLRIDVPGQLGADAIEAIRGHSLLYGLFEHREDGSLMPLCGRAAAAIGEDLPAILKYKGKTNELFTQLLIDLALYASDFWDADGPLRLLDPMCGRATAPFIALNRGWDAVGADIDRADLKEAERFLKRYLEYHRFKHALSRTSRTLAGKKAVPVVSFETAATPEAFKAGRTVSLSLIELDAARAAEVLGRAAFHLVVCDLPYGVRHDAHLPNAPRGGNWLETLTSQLSAGCMTMLKPGGAVAVSVNAQTFPRKRVRACMAQAGLEVMSGGPYDDLEHWVEQAITRDVAVGRRPV